ncbi:helix-turn-helix transcriptional regulator [Trinickia sp. LjRoot230]|uniref:helix-turn-helix transcriptional regulator n=1 Tax=Trinickia sp. LjRoot230 TaxID=3342288 RepID=UPI003ECFD79F
MSALMNTPTRKPVHASRAELGNFLRARRERLEPAALGIETIRRRRTSGLRREEVAERAGIGVDWYIRLEQGRDVNPSSATIDALARALCLSSVEHAHLRALARVDLREPFVRETVPDSVRRVVENLAQPAYVTGRRWDVLAWNAAAVELFTDFGAMPKADRNILVYALTHPDARRLFGTGWAREAQRLVAQFRAAHDLWAGDPAFVSLLARLSSGCPEFDGWWQTHDVGRSAAGRKLLRHPRFGTVSVDFATFQANDDPRLKLMLYNVKRARARR